MWRIRWGMGAASSRQESKTIGNGESGQPALPPGFSRPWPAALAGDLDSPGAERRAEKSLFEKTLRQVNEIAWKELTTSSGPASVKKHS